MVNQIINVIIAGIIAIIAAIVLIIIVKNKHLRKALLYIIACAIIVCGIFCSIQFFKEATATSYVRGEITTRNSFSQEQFMYSTSSLSLYEDVYNNTYSYESEQLPVDDFNGRQYTYEVKLNNFNIIDADIDSGNIAFTVHMKFYSPTNELLCNGSIKFNIKFLSNKTMVSIITYSNEEASFFEQYFDDYGLKLEVNKKS